MEKVIEHAQKKAKEKIIRPESNSSDVIEKHLKEMRKNDTWPFRTVTIENFINVIRPLVQTVYDIYQESGDINNGKSVELLQDTFYARVSSMLRCVQAMGFETDDQKNKEAMLQKQGKEYVPKYDEMYKTLAWAKDELYRLTDHTNAFMKHTYKITEQTPLDVKGEWEKEVRPRMAIEETYKATKAHSQAFHQLARQIDPLVKHGLPSETAFGQWLDARRKDTVEIKGKKVEMTVTEIKKMNENAVKDLIRAQMAIDRVELIFLPKLRQNYDELVAKARMEDLAIEQAGLRGKSAYWEDAYQLGKKIKAIEKTISNTEKREADRTAKLDITRTKDGVYSLTASKDNGGITEDKEKGKDVTRTTTISKWARETKRTMNLGSMSAALRQEQKDREAIIYGKKVATERKTHSTKRQEEKIKTIKERIFGKVSLSTIRNTRLSGSRTARLQATATLTKLMQKITRSHKEGIENKQTVLLNSQAEIGASAKMELPTEDRIGFSASADAYVSAKVQSEALGPNIALGAKIGPSASIGKVMSLEDFEKQTAKIFAQEILKGNNMDMKAVFEKYMEMLQEAGPKAAMEWGDFNFEVGGFKVGRLKADLTFDEETQEYKYLIDEKSSPIAKDVHQDAQALVKAAKEAYQYFTGAAAYSEQSIIPHPSVRNRQGIEMLQR